MTYKGMSKPELISWLGFLGFWLAAIAAFQSVDWNTPLGWGLALAIIPGLIALAAPQAFVYGLIAFIINLLTARWGMKVRAPLTLVVLFGIATLAPVLIDSRDVKAGQALRKDDMTGRPTPNARVVAFLFPKDAREATGDPTMCNVYCQRLLYTGEAETVLVGATPGEETFGSGWRGIPLKAYSIVSGASCPAPELSSGRDSTEKDVRQSVSLQDAIATRSEAGECLSTRAGSLAEAQLVVVEQAINARNDTSAFRSTLRRIEVFQSQGTDLSLVSRRTYADFVPVTRPLFFWVEKGFRFEFSRFGHARGYKPLDRLTTLREIAGLGLGTPTAPSPETLRRVVSRTLESRANHTGPSPAGGYVDHGRIDQYLESLTRRPTTDEDMQLVRQIIRDRKRPDRDYWGLQMALRSFGPRAAEFAPDLMDELEAADPRHQDGRIHSMAWSFAKLPPEAIARFYPRLLVLAQDRAFLKDGWPAVTRLAYGTADKALPLFVGMIQSDNVEVRRPGAIGLCLMGTKALPAKDLIMDRVVSGHGSYALTAAVWRMGLYEDYKARRRAMPRSTTERMNDESDFRAMPRVYARDAQKGDDELCKD